jgi:hypothetical protein
MTPEWALCYAYLIIRLIKLPWRIMMSILLIEHLKASELPDQWAQRLQAAPEQTVTVRIETEPVASTQTHTQATETFVTNDPAFGIWRDREDLTDINAYVQQLRAPLIRRKYESQ